MHGVSSFCTLQASNLQVDASLTALIVRRRKKEPKQDTKTARELSSGIAQITDWCSLTEEGRLS